MFYYCFRYLELQTGKWRLLKERKRKNDCNLLHICSENCDVDHKEIHNDDEFTFELPYDVTGSDQFCPSGSIFRPNPRFMTNILSITPPNSADNTVVLVGRYEGAHKRVPDGGDPTIVRVGLDAARFGSDLGKMYVYWQDAVWLACEFFKQNTEKYVDTIVEECKKLKEKGVKNSSFVLTSVSAAESLTLC